MEQSENVMCFGVAWTMRGPAWLLGAARRYDSRLTLEKGGNGAKRESWSNEKNRATHGCEKEKK